MEKVKKMHRVVSEITVLKSGAASDGKAQYTSDRLLWPVTGLTKQGGQVSNWVL